MRHLQRRIAVTDLFLVLSILGCDTGPQLFHDAARELDLEYISYSGDHLWYLIDTLGAGVAVGDYDNDGDADIFLLTGAAILDAYQEEAAEHTNALWRNNGDGTFTDVTEEASVGRWGWSNGAVFADYDGDGDLDIALARHGPNVLWRNNGDGTFTEVSASAGIDGNSRWSSTATLADFDGDEDLDLYFTNYADFVIAEQKDKVGWFDDGLLQFPQHFEPTDNTLYRNNGDGTFTDITEEAAVSGTGRSLGALATDYDADGDTDLFVANDVGFNDMFRNDGDMKFTEVALESGLSCDAEGRFQACMGVAGGDYDSDGDIDIMVTNYGSEYHTLYRNDGEGFFSDTTAEAGLVSQSTLDTVGWGVGLYDFDLDGNVDILSVNGHVVGNTVLWYMRHFTDGEGDIPQMNPESFNLGARQTKHLFLGRGDGTFEDASATAGSNISAGRMGRGAAFADLDLDGRVDVVVSNKNEPAQLLLNRIPTTGHWIRLELRSRAPNVFAIGALARVHVSGKVTAREVFAGTSYLSSDDLTLHYGLGQATRADRAVVRWPDGSVEEFRDLEGDRTHRLEQSRYRDSGKPTPASSNQSSEQ